MSFKNTKIKQQVKNMPKLPGCYQYFDSNNEIIYIGKAKNLKNRVSSYFSSSVKNLKTQLLVSNIDSIEYIITVSEQDAFSLESNLIKENQPKYNLLRDELEEFHSSNQVRRLKAKSLTWHQVDIDIPEFA